MADGQFSAASLPSHPMAKPGYGKRATPPQHRPTAHDFAHLPPREAAIAAYVDRLPDGADISVKTLAKELPYGQCALGTALNRLQKAGHLRRGRETVTVEGSTRWITRTWWSRTAREGEWWATFVRGDAPEPHSQETAPPRSTRSRAHILLAALGRETPALSLSAAECAALAPLVGEWYARGATDEAVRTALTSGLPTPVHHPAALLRTRLTAKLPPEPEPVRPPRRMLECAICGAPGRPESLPDGVCAACHPADDRAPAQRHPNAPLPAASVHTLADGIRAAMSEMKQRDEVRKAEPTGVSPSPRPSPRRAPRP